MFINFGSGKCPVCGDFGKSMTKDIFHCLKCRISFNDYYISNVDGLKDYESKYWN